MLNHEETSKGSDMPPANTTRPAQAHHEAKKKKTEVIDTLHPTRREARADASSYIRTRELTDTAKLDQAQLFELYRYLYETRRLEEHIVALSRQNKVVGGVYRSLGQEATAVGCAYALKSGDFLQPLIRDLGATLVHGVSPIAMLRQYMAKSTGPSGGRDLNTHFSDPNVGILGPVSMLGAMVPVLAGCVLGSRYKGLERAGLAFIGDGGSSTGAFYEGMNFAAVQRLPLTVVIESNHYAYSTPTTSQVPDGDLVRRATGFGCTVAHVDGNDVLACYEAAAQARARGLEDKGPTIIVSETYRRRGHAEHDNQQYVPEGEITDWQSNNDPVERFTQFLLKGGHSTKKQIESIAHEVEAQLNVARDEAINDPQPNPDTLTHGVFADDTRPWPPVGTWFRGAPTNRPADRRAREGVSP